MPKTDKVVGLRLTLGGAPSTLHWVGDLGTFRPDVPRPVGGPGELPLELAQQYHNAPGVPLELVEVDDPDSARAVYAADVKDARAGVRVAMRQPDRDGADVARANAERAALRSK